MLKKLFASMSALILAVSPVLAQVTLDRSAVASRSADSEESEAQGGTGIIIAVVAAAAVVGGVVVVADDEDEPTSP
jgi:hypothetical protein